MCAGAFYVSFFSQAVNVSFLYLFGSFYVVNYLSKPKGKDVKPKDGKKSGSKKDE